MSLPWFCMYSEWAIDPKVQMLSEAMQRRMVMLFCDECSEQTHMSDEQRAFKWRITPEGVVETKTLFLEHGIIDEDWNVIKWDKRQRRDLSTSRVQKHRAMKRDETLHETDGTVSETFQTVLHNITRQDRTIHNKQEICASAGAKVVATWNQLTEGKLQSAKLTPSREKLVAARLAEDGWLDDFAKACAFVAGSEFHQGGHDGRGWVATIDYLLKPGKAAELAEKSPVKAPAKRARNLAEMKAEREARMERAAERARQ